MNRKIILPQPSPSDIYSALQKFNNSMTILKNNKKLLSRRPKVRFNSKFLSSASLH